MGSPTTEDAPITILPHSAEWAELFASEAKALRTALDLWLVAEIEHIGSTEVAELSAKPVIDIMAPVRDLESSRGAIAAAESVGYCSSALRFGMHCARTHPWRSSTRP